MSTNLPALLAVISAAGNAGVPTCLWGDPGTGKSSLIRALAHSQELPCETVLGSLREPSDFAGLPVVTDTGVRFDAPTWAKRLASADNGGWLFLDELSTATPAVQKAMLGVVLDRTVGDLQLPPTVKVIAAANDPDKAADGWDLTPPLANRFLHVDYSPAVTDWLDGLTTAFPIPAAEPLAPLDRARKAIARANVVGFLRSRTELVHAYPTNDAATGRAWPSRRTWTMLADVLSQITTDAAAEIAAGGLVGDGPGSEYLTWREHADLPDPADLIANPDTYPWADLTPDRAWAALSSVVALASAPGTIKDWQTGWKPLAAAAENGLAAVAAACARSLMLARPTNAKPPASVKRFAPVWADAGLLPTA